ncbi:hypothetical protein ACJX0J_019691, partial [Zea mays]
ILSLAMNGSLFSINIQQQQQTIIDWGVEKYMLLVIPSDPTLAKRPPKPKGWLSHITCAFGMLFGIAGEMYQIRTSRSPHYMIVEDEFLALEITHFLSMFYQS